MKKRLIIVAAAVAALLSMASCGPDNYAAQLMGDAVAEVQNA